ncbi:hydrogenase maturation protease [Arcobacter arenosus]|jgi:hydrogenase maturation protease|uniref:Hydrogenase maturation protease n=1 Tax=Arcobacter arenosus TaxID=2576037 RepID=A0A5R8Y1M3_9BACT|nr:hydrogenase maturation protease [Arcobacter arenosus]TLP38462.1 hydrogenase maturation protease [Arcobacter arenosus]
MTIIVGFGNDLRGEDGFGIDVIKKLQNYDLPNTKLISTFQLTPELSLELKEATRLIFIDATFSNINNYSLACNLEEYKHDQLSHHISIRTILMILERLYNTKPEYELYSMFTNSFNEIIDEKNYEKAIKKVVEFIKTVN